MRYDNVPTFMAYTGDKPWHGQGMKLDEALRPSEFLARTGMGFKVAKMDIFTAGVTPGGESWAEEADGFKAIARVDDNGKPTHGIWNVVSDRYSVWSMDEMGKLGDSIADACGGQFKINTGGMFGHGRKVWMWGKIAPDCEIVRGDIIQHNLCLANSFDGSMTFRANMTDVRPVCENTLGHALAGSYSVRHVGDLILKTEEIAEALGLIAKQAETQDNDYRTMVETRMGVSDFMDIVKVIYPEDTDLQMQNREVLQRTFQYSPTIAGIPGVNGTAWGALNSFTEFIDHEVKARSDDRRFEMALFGAGAEIKDKALEQIHIYMGKAKAGPQTIAI